METITLSYEKGGAFAIALARFLADNDGFSITERKSVAKRKRKTNYEQTLDACKEADEGKGTLFADLEDFKRHIHAL